MTELFDSAWAVLEKAIMFDGVEHEDVDTAIPAIMDYIDNYRDTKFLPPLPFKGGAKTPGGKRRGVPWTRMIDEGSSDALYQLPGYTDPESEMFPTAFNWIGGKTSIMPQIRTLTAGIRNENPNLIPAEIFGGSGSFLMGMNDPRGRGFYNDINPDIVNIQRHLKAGLGNVSIPQTPEELNEYIEALNYLRRMRDVDGIELSPDEKKFMAELYIGANLQQRDGMFSWRDWETDGWPLEVPYTDGIMGGASFRQASVPEGHPNYRKMPYQAGRIDLRPFAKPLRNTEIFNYDFRDAANLLTDDHLLYLDPPYMTRGVEYGGAMEQLWGHDYDQTQKDVVDIMGEHGGPSIYSNYMFGRNTDQPFYDLIGDLLDRESTIHPWLRKPKANQHPQVELIATRNF